MLYLHITSKVSVSWIGLSESSLITTLSASHRICTPFSKRVAAKINWLIVSKVPSFWKSCGTQHENNTFINNYIFQIFSQHISNLIITTGYCHFYIHLVLQKNHFTEFSTILFHRCNTIALKPYYRMYYWN